MPAKPLNSEQLQDAERLRAAFEKAKQERGLTQTGLAEECGWSTQGTVSQYLGGKIPLNWPALVKMSRALKVDPADISPSLASRLGTVASLKSEPEAAQTVRDLQEFLRVYGDVPAEKRRDLIDIVMEFGQSFGRAERDTTANNHL